MLYMGPPIVMERNFMQRDHMFKIASGVVLRLYLLSSKYR